MEYIVEPVLNWFNHLSTFIKIIVLLFGGLAIYGALLGVVSRIATLLAGLIFDKLPQNWFTLISSLVLAFANGIWNLIILWSIPNKYNFWIVLELLILSGFILSLCAVVMPAKEQIKDLQRHGG